MWMSSEENVRVKREGETMVAKKTKNIVFWVGVGIVVATHIYMLIAGLPQSQMMGHALLNLVAVGLIVYGRKA